MQIFRKFIGARAASLDLDKIGRREDRTHQTEIQNIFAIVAGGHHANGHTHAGFAGFVGLDEICRTAQVVVRES